MKKTVTYVRPGSPAQRVGIRVGDAILTVNGEEIIDEIDYQALTAPALVSIELEGKDGERRHVTVIKPQEDALGLELDESLAITPRTCANRCVFCFVDQMAPGMRETLYVKDDDWRLSLMMGSFITLTNLGKKEFDRILRRKASPLYISVHTTNMALREKMLRCPKAAELMDQLRAMTEHGIDFHAQVVLCPGWNDGPELDRTLKDLEGFFPHVKSIALVPVGLTRFRENLTPLTPYDTISAQALLHQAEAWQQKFLAAHGTRLVFPADEFYSIAGCPVPEEEAYEGYPQIENGVGMLRQLEEEFRAAAQMNAGAQTLPGRSVVACGTGLAPFMESLFGRYAPRDAVWEVRPVRNTFFGETVTVSGLLTGKDLTEQLRAVKAERILLTRGILRSEGDLTLDDMPVDTLRHNLPCPVTFVSDGYELYEALIREERT